MTTKECDLLIEISTLMNKCPAPSPNPYDLTGFIHACKDYEKILNLVSNVLQYLAFYSSLRTKNHEEVDEGYIEYCKEKSEEDLIELREFVDKRVKEGWT